MTPLYKMTFRIRGRELLPIVQGGMGAGISRNVLAAAVAKIGGVGTIASVELRHAHDDLAERSSRRPVDPQAVIVANREALDREIRLALDGADGCGLIAVNVMQAVTDYKGLVIQACESGTQAIVVGAGLPTDLPELTKNFPDVALIPILSDARGVEIILKKWAKKGRLPDAIIIEHPRYAGGHLGARDALDTQSERFDFETVLPEILAVYRKMNIRDYDVPLIAAGGINSREKIRHILHCGARAVQLGTPFIATDECDAHPNFKRVIAEARPEDIVTIMSAAGLPARAVLTPWLAKYLARDHAHMAEVMTRKIRSPKCKRGVQCLKYCGLTDAKPTTAGYFCIANQLVAALKGDIENGLFFRGAATLPFGSDIVPVRKLIAHLLEMEKC